MLVLTRKQNEQITIGDDIKITLVRIRGNSVRIGIEAPRDVRVVRGELRNREQVDRLEFECETAELDSVLAHPGNSLAPPKATGTTSRTEPSKSEVQSEASIQSEALVRFSTGSKSKAPVRSLDGGNHSSDQAPRILYGRIRPLSSERQPRRAPLADFVSAT